MTRKRSTSSITGLLSELNARVVLSGRSRERLEETAGQMSGEGHRIEPFDLNETDAIPDWVKRIVAQTGPLGGAAAESCFSPRRRESSGRQGLPSMRRVRRRSSV